MMKSVLVAIDRTKKIPKYRTTVKMTTKLMAHDEKNECQVGDTVRIRLCRPLSKNKSFTVTDVLQKSKVLHLNQGKRAPGGGGDASVAQQAGFHSGFHTFASR
jgi:small subunit ribosomal protein S17